MIRVSAIIFLLLILEIPSTYAQTGHGMMRDGHMGGGGSMMGDGGMMDDGMRGLRDIFQGNQQQENQMTMKHRHMMTTMMDATQDMAIMMRQLSVIMGHITDMDGSTSRDRVYRMSGLMKNMSAEMNRISDMIAKGTASDEEVRTIQKRMSQMQQEMWELK